MNKKHTVCLALLLFAIAFSCAFYLYQTHYTTSDSTMKVTSTFNTTPTPSKNQNETTNTTNQTAFSVPLEKPPFI